MLEWRLLIRAVDCEGGAVCAVALDRQRVAVVVFGIDRAID